MSDSFQAITVPGVPTLPAVPDPVELGKCLGLFSSAPWNWGELRDVHVQILKSHTNRRTVEILLRTTTACRSVIGKFYAEDRSDVYQTMDAISRAGFGPDAEFSIPQPFAFLPKLNLLLTEKVQGVRAKDIFVNGTERERAEAAKRCALWLTRFHSTADRSGPAFDLNDYLISLERWSRRIAEISEPLAGKADRLFRGLELAASAPPPSERCAGHGSYCHAQIILANGRTATYDWDSHDVADPGRDVARFIVSLGRLALRYLGSMRALDSAAEVFLNTYLLQRGRNVQERLPFHKAATCIKIAKYEIPRPACASRTAIIEEMLDEGLRILEQWR